MNSQYQEVQTLNQYIAALERQVKSFENQRRNLFQHVSRLEDDLKKTDAELRILKNQFKDTNSTLYKLTVDKNSLENKLKMTNDELQKVKRESEAKEQKIISLNNVVREKNQAINKEKANLTAVSTYNSKQFALIQDNIKELQKRLKETTEQNNQLSVSLISTSGQLTSQKEENDKLKLKNATNEKYIQTLLLNIKQMQNQIIQIKKDRQTLKDTFQKTCEELFKTKQSVESLSLQLVSGNQNNEESKKAYQNLINNMKAAHSDEFQQIKQEMQKMMFQFQQKSENLNNQIKQLQNIKEIKTIQIKRLRAQVDNMNEQIEKYKKLEITLNTQLKNYEQNLTKSIGEFTNTNKALGENLIKLKQNQREVQRLRKELKDREQKIARLTSQIQLKKKQFTKKEVELTKALKDFQAKCSRLNTSFEQSKKEMEQKENDLNKKISILMNQKSLQVQQIALKSQKQLNELKVKYSSEVELLNRELQYKSNAINQLEDQLSRYQLTSLQLSSNHTSMEKMIMMLQKQLSQSHQQINSYHQKMFSLNNSVDNIKEQVIQKDIKIMSLNQLLEKVQKENLNLFNQTQILREQVTALENSTLYLKRQLKTTLERQQSSLEEIKNLQEVKRSFHKLLKSSSVSSLNAKRFQKNRSLQNLGTWIKGGDSQIFNQIQELNGQGEEKNEEQTFLKESIVLPKISKKQNTTSLESFGKYTYKLIKKNLDGVPETRSYSVSSSRNTALSK